MPKLDLVFRMSLLKSYLPDLRGHSNARVNFCLFHLLVAFNLFYSAFTCFR
jgi:hypothetical protein